MFEKAGGAVPQTGDPKEHTKVSKALKDNQLAGTAPGYAARALADGIQVR